MNMYTFFEYARTTYSTFHLELPSLCLTPSIIS